MSTMSLLQRSPYILIMESSETLKSNHFIAISGLFTPNLGFRLLTFCCKKVIYIWDDERQDFIKLSGLDKGVSLHELRESKGLAIKDQFLRYLILKSIRKVPVLIVFTLGKSFLAPTKSKSKCHPSPNCCFWKY